jgi:ComF family protein
MGLLDLLYPRQCLGCKSPGCYICKYCITEVSKTGFLCSVCGRASREGKTHYKCKTPHAIDSHIAIWNYDGVIRKAIIAVKYKFASALIEEIANYAVNEINKRFSYLTNPYLLVPIPTTRLRYNWRGFNQSEEMAKLIAKKLNWKCVPDLLIKKSTKAQTGLKLKERVKNPRGAFRLNKKVVVSQDFPVLIFDDVWTTGSTMKEAAKVLKRNGFGNVSGLTIAQTGRYH